MPELFQALNEVRPGLHNIVNKPSKNLDTCITNLDSTIILKQIMFICQPGQQYIS